MHNANKLQVPFRCPDTRSQIKARARELRPIVDGRSGQSRHPPFAGIPYRARTVQTANEECAKAVQFFERAATDPLPTRKDPDAQTVATANRAIRGSIAASRAPNCDFS